MHAVVPEKRRPEFTRTKSLLRTLHFHFENSVEIMGEFVCPGKQSNCTGKLMFSSTAFSELAAELLSLLYPRVETFISIQTYN